MNVLYLPNQVQAPINRSFAFNRKNERIDWRRIAALDVDRVARDLDFQAIQENIEQITLCNIDAEVDTRAMDPNFPKLYKMAQLTIEYLLLCQDQISGQLVDYELMKSKGTSEQDDFHRQIAKLKNDLNETKRESKKRKKLLETQEKLLLAQRPHYHTCPLCAHSFLNGEFLQAHIHRRHPDLDPNRRREHDVDIEKELQRLREELKHKQNDLQLLQVQKGVDDEKIREREESIRQLKEEIRALTSKNTILEEKYFTLRSSNQSQSPSPQRREAGVKELLKENTSLRAENEQLRQASQQTEAMRKKLDKLKRRELELQNEIDRLKESLRSGDSSRISEELAHCQQKYNEEKARRKQLEDELDRANRQLAQFRNQPPPIMDRKSPVPPPRTAGSPVPPPAPPAPTPHTRPAPTRLNQPVELVLPEYCPALVRRMNQDPNYLNSYRQGSKRQFQDELDQFQDLNIKESETRLKDNEYPIKLDVIQESRRLMQQDLPEFERIRADLSATLERLAQERLTNAGSPTRSPAHKVTFEDQSRAQHHHHQHVPSKPIQKGKTDTRISFEDEDDDEEEKTNTYFNDSEESEENYPARTQPAVQKLIQTSVRPKSAVQKYESESDHENGFTPRPSNPVSVTNNVKIIDRKLTEASIKGQKPTINAIAQGFQPSRQTLATHHDDDDSESLTSIHDINAPRKATVITQLVTQNPVREATSQNYFSSGDVSQYTYDSQTKSALPAGRGNDLRRQTTADSAKTSIGDSEDDDSR